MVCNKLIKLILVIFWLPLIVRGGENHWIKYGWQVYQNKGDARSLALGNTMSAESTMPLFNPAGSRNGQRSFGYAHQSRFGGIVQSDLITFNIMSAGKTPLNISILYSGIGRLINTETALMDANGNGILDEDERLNSDSLSYFSQNQWGLHLSRYWQLKNLRIGLGFKGLFHFLGQHTGIGVGVDIGLLTTTWYNIDVGLVVQDVTTSWLVWENGTREISAPILQLGANKLVVLKRLGVSCKLLFGLLIDGTGKSTDDKFSIMNLGVRFNEGLELKIKDHLLLRVGRNTGSIISAGLGLRWEVIEINYAFQPEPISSDLGYSHHLSFKLDPEWTLKNFIKIL